MADKYLVRDYTHKDGLVVDFCMRHGITGVAALGLNRRFIGVELDRGSYELAKGRLADRFALTWSDGRTSGSSVDTLVPFSPVIATPVMVTPTPLLETPPTIVAAKTRKESIKKPTPVGKSRRFASPSLAAEFTMRSPLWASACDSVHPSGTRSTQ